MGPETAIAFGYFTKDVETVTRWQEAAKAYRDMGQAGESLLAGDMFKAITDEEVARIEEPTVRALCLCSIQRADMKEAARMLLDIFKDGEESTEDCDEE